MWSVITPIGVNHQILLLSANIFLVRSVNMRSYVIAPKGLFWSTLAARREYMVY